MGTTTFCADCHLPLRPGVRHHLEECVKLLLRDNTEQRSQARHWQLLYEEGQRTIKALRRDLAQATRPMGFGRRPQSG